MTQTAIDLVKEYIDINVCVGEDRVREYIGLFGYPQQNVKLLLIEVAKDKKYKLYNIQNFFVICNYQKMLNRYRD